MPSMVAPARKRKQTEDVDESPPKRVTRARAAKSAAIEPEKTTNTKRITTASARVAAIPKAATKTTRAPAKRVAIAETSKKDEDVEMGELAEEPVVKKTRGRPAKDVPSDRKAEPAKTPRTRTTKTAATIGTETAKPITRTRSRTATVAGKDDVASEPARKATRGVTKSTSTKREATTTKKAVTKKSVTFEDSVGQDKENVPLAPDDKKSSTKATGMRAKPVKKVATVKASSTKASAAKATGTRSTRGKKTATDNSEEEENRPLSAPLSPKKVTQVAKSVSSGSEDELCDRAPARALSKSPVKAPPSVHSTMKVASRDFIGQPPSPISPSKSIGAPLLLSPAKRPPPSPFKDAIRLSPKKVALPGANLRLEVPGQSPFKDSLKASPRKMPTASFTSAQSLTTNTSPLKASLLKSPAKRPTSPEKINLFNSPSKSARLSLGKDALLAGEATFQLPNITPQRLFISPRAENAEQETPSVVDQAVLHIDAQDTNEPSFIEGTPAKVAFAQYRENPLAAYEARNKKMEVPEDSAIRHEDRASDSEDELLSGTPTLAAYKNAVTPTPRTPNAAASRRETLGITPLALKLSTWYTNSPQKKLPESSIEEEAEPLAATNSPSPSESSVIHNRDVSPAKPSFFEDELFATEQELEDTLMANEADEIVGETPADAVVWGEVQAAFKEPTAELDLETTAIEVDAELLDDAVDGDILLNDEIEILETDVEYVEQSTAIEPEEDPAPALPESNHTSQETISVLGDSEGAPIELPEEEPVEIDDQDLDFMQEVSQASFEFGDENAIPLDLQSFAQPAFDFGLEVTTVEPELEDIAAQPEVSDNNMDIGRTVFTPARPIQFGPREVHTVCKVPLRAEGVGMSPIKVPRKRSKSTSAPVGGVSTVGRPSMLRNNMVISYSPEPEENTLSAVSTPAKSVSKSPRKVSYETSVINAMMTPQSEHRSVASSPVKSVRKGADARILKGATVYVDVHTSEGADASSIFVDLLTQMGARCVKQWNWNSRTSAPAGDSTPGNKIGITHVVFKDGSKRSLQKVREAKGQVLCVGVGWVLDCERENNWLDEAQYAVDTSTIPRGGHNRRKSMEPKALSNLNGNLVPAETPSKAAGYEIASPDNRYSFSASSRRDSIRVSIGPESLAELNTESELEGLVAENDFKPVPEEDFDFKVPATPSPATPGFGERIETGAFGSPTTPYFLSKGAQLVQQTCPPKQTMQSLFPVSGRIEDQPDESVRQRLMMARRKSLQWAPKVGSPLGRAVSYGKHR